MRVVFSEWTICLAAVLIVFSTAVVSANDAVTQKHEKGRCAMRNHCGTTGWLRKPLPCPDNGLAEQPDEDLRSKIVSLCGAKWSDGPVCCTDEQVESLKSNLKTANNFISSCPACLENFYNLFCTFSCSPDQSLFVNITATETNGEKLVVTELDQLWSDRYGSDFYDSCKDVKFGALNTRAMSLIGGGANNYTELLTFLGKKSDFGSPFQINFPRPNGSEFTGMKAQDPKAYPCNSTDSKYRCSCVDCESSCPELSAVKEAESCYIGLLPCLSFAIIIVYSIFILLLVAAISGHVAYRHHAKDKNERLRLLQDTTLSDDDDDDEGEIVYQPAVLGRAPRRYRLNTICDRMFNSLGRKCAQFPAITISISFIVVALLTLGWLRFEIETDPVRLWVAPDSAPAQEKIFFDENFGPFFRAEQAFLANDSSSHGPGPVLTYETLSWWADVENQVRRLKSSKYGVTFEDVCYNPTGKGCIVQSVTAYFDKQPEKLNPSDWRSELEACIKAPTDCLPNFGQPLKTNLILGGWNESILDAEALVVTWVVKNHAEGSKEIKEAMDFEESLKTLLLSVQTDAQARGLRLSFNTEASLQQELNKSSNTDVTIVVVSYIVMFLYASLALGSTTLAAKSLFAHPTRALVESKFMLGIMGIVIVLMSVIASVGLFSALGVKVTLIIAEVIPFLVLAVGVDNIFLIVHEFERVNLSHPDEIVEARVGKALGRMGPSILLSATMETVAFALGTFVGMPAVRNFAAYAAGAVFINALLQVTMFVSVLALNQQRVEDGRMDCIPCLRVAHSSSLMYSGAVYGSQKEDGLQEFIRRTYAPAILGNKAKTIIITIFLGLFTAGIALLPEVRLGLDQRVALPTDSYLIDYFNDLYAYFDSGPPVYFVTRDVNVMQRMHQKQLCGRFVACNEYSLSSVLEQERQRREVSHIADSAASWIDDFFLFLAPTSENCCVDPATKEPCFANRDPPWNITLHGMPEGKEFVHYLKGWLATQPNTDCPIAGKAAYLDAVVYNEKDLTIPASHFRTSHTPLKSQADFIAAYASARRIADYISAQNDGISVFPYSKFYIFFDQYATIVQLTAKLISSAIIACLIISGVLLGSIRTGLVVGLTVTMTVIDIIGSMAVAGVDLNAVSLVNLVICVGIAVEFCAHIARAFQFPSARLIDRSGVVRVKTRSAPNGRGGPTPNSAVATFRGRDARAWAALTQVGGSVFSGITITKLLGVCVLAFTSSKIFEIYYFRIWLSLVIFAATHALIFLPVALSLLGGEGYIDPDREGGLEEDLASRRGRPLMSDDGEDDADDSDGY